MKIANVVAARQRDQLRPRDPRRDARARIASYPGARLEMRWDDMWHGWNDGGWTGWGIGMLGMALFWIVVIVAVVFAVRALGDRSRWGGPPRPPRETPLELLQRRYASGEIDKKEFEEKKKDLS